MTDAMTQGELDEVRRDRKVWTTLIVLGVLVATVTLVFGWRLVEGRLEAAKRLDRAMTLLRESDSAVTSVDEVVRAGATVQTAAKAAEVAPLVDGTRALLTEANKLAGDGIERLTDDEQEKALLVQGAATARLALLEPVPVLLSATQQATAAEALASEAWTKALAADALARSAVTDYNKLKKADVKDAAAANKEAQGGFAAAGELLERAALAFPDAQLGAFSEYVEGRLKLVALSQKASDAWLAGDTTQANKLRVEYNKTDEVLVQRAKRLPGTPSAAIAAAYEALVKTPMAEYYKAREKAAAADNALGTL